ncbi:prepilin-type N-terminal cleavage/methylation domain-containing protein [Stieleria sp. ICT_E10.1]|uniref:PulJ/GspJ family protein n=1 Tax=Stieleria sedimenti TaxID=2976331 RepID=UPI00218018E8|nr:prepilin-type N-terminal cleavage/methylation domain-containing protein [Stieleria sedimenti]MCS7468852.1 prepilin-type N-terminal cleavage/methylation domain-containing protein [Stieleria sedimenti]
MKSLTRTRTARRGFTLRELSIAIAIGSSVMMVAVGLVHHAFDWSTLARHRRSDDQTFFQLSRQLRDDLHVAHQADLDSGDTSGQSLRLSVNGNDLVYTLTDMTVTRTERHGDAVVRNEVYRFKRPRTLVLTRLEADNQIQLNVKTITPFAESETPLWRSLRISIGLRLRHQNGDIAS